MFSAWDLDHPLEQDQEYELYHMANPRRTTPAYHSHDFYEIYFFISGDASAYIEEYAFRLHSGDVVIFPPGVMHRAFFHNPEAYYERMFMYISRETLRGMGNRDYSLLEVIDGCIARAQFRHHLSAEDFSYCRFMINEIISDAIDNMQPYQSLINKCKMNLLMTMLCKWFGESKDEQNPRSIDRIGNVIAYINQHLDEDLSLDELGSRFFVSKYHLMREFKSYTNRTVYQYILSKRVNQAKLMLQSGVGPSDVALRCGFGDYSSFYKAFKKETELSPNQYLNCLRAGQQPKMI